MVAQYRSRQCKIMTKAPLRKELHEENRLSGYETGIANFRNPYRSHEFQWGIGDVVTALLQAGLTLEVLKEYPYTNGCKTFERMCEAPERQMFPPQDVPNIPLMYGIIARNSP